MAVAKISDLEIIATRVLGVATTLAGLFLGAMLVRGGFQLLTAGGDANKAKAARETIFYALLGLILFIGAWFILRLIGAFTGIPNLGNFQLEV